MTQITKLLTIIILLVNFNKERSYKLTKKDIEILERGKFVDSEMISLHQFQTPDNQNKSQDHLEKEKFLRSLSSETTLNDVGFIYFPQRNIRYTYWAYQHILGNIQKYKSTFIVYPWAFTYIHQDDEETTSTLQNPYGGFFTLAPDNLPKDDAAHPFWHISNITNVNIGKSKAIYDIDIAILSIETKFNGNLMNLFTETDAYCTFFISRLEKVEECLNGKNELEEYRTSSTTSGTVVLIDNKELNTNNLLFTNDGSNNFGLLIIPDHVYGSESVIENLLTSNGIQKIKTFIQQGGNVLASGKSGYLLEKWGILSEGSYDTSKFLYAKNSDSNAVKIKGCEDTVNKFSSEQTDFIKQLLCENDLKKSYLVSTYPMVSYSQLDVIMTIDVSNSQGVEYKNADGVETALGADSSKTFPFLLTKQDEGQGRIFILNGNSLTNSDYAYPILNCMFYSMGKNVIFDAYIKYDSDDDDIPVPGGEEGVQLNAFFQFLNLYETSLSSIYIDIFIPNLVSFSEIPSGCTLTTNDKSIYKSVTDMNILSYVRCSQSSLDGYSKYSKSLKIEIESAEVTQKATSIPIFYPYIRYHDDNTGEDIIIDNGVVTVEAALAAILRCTANPEPGGKYPLKGRGNDFSLVFNVENKENTIASDVSLYTIIPLITPLVEGGDHGTIAHIVEFHKQYYSSHGFTFPWSSTGSEYDFIDYAELSGNGVVVVKDFDTPVKFFKVGRDEVTYSNKYNPSDTSIDVDDSQTTLTNSQTILKEMYFGDADLFYESAQQRKLLFVDTSTTEGANTQYGSSIPDDIKDPDDETKAKVMLGFARCDIYFLDNINYQLPTGTNGSLLFSVDQYDAPTKNFVNKVDLAKSYIVVNGRVDSSYSDDPIVPNQWSNRLRQVNGMKLLNPTKESDMNTIKSFSNGDITLSHFLIIESGDRIKRAGSVMNFTENSDGLTGYLTEYPSVKFIYAHTVSVTIEAAMTRLGGKFEISLGSYEFNTNDPVGNELITTSADGVSFYKTEYDSSSNIVTIYFKRGLMPDESNDNDSNQQINFEGITTKSNIPVTITLYAMKYDLSSPDTNYESYTVVSSFSTSYTMKYCPFWSFPALIIKNTMNRNEATTIKEYEILNPYARYRLYYQELLRHRPIWGSVQSNHITDTGLQSNAGGFSLIGNIGISSIPFADYVNHGILATPSVTYTSRLEWKDVWGRHWSQPIRTILPDTPPLPSPYMSFMMSTTYELYDSTGKTRLLEWPSDENMFIHVQMKFTNNYFKYFSPTVCLKNQEPFFNNNGSDATEDVGDSSYIKLGHSLVYGTCYQSTSAYLNGTKITSSIIEGMNEAMVCASTGDADTMAACAKKLKELNLPQLKGKSGYSDDDDATPNKTWNYSPDVNSYYPKNYINEKEMWSFQKIDYADNYFEKGYPWTFDNGIPGLDGLGKPDNMVAFPIFKGFGYKIDYDPSYTFSKYKKYKGWWSDNLQNQDNTLLAGQSSVNTISVGKSSLLKSTDWINAKDIEPSSVKNKLKNIYVCLFNQHRVKVTPYQSILSHPDRTYQNNVIPVLPDLTSEDTRYTNYDCNDKTQYDSTNISEVDNRVYTNNDRDWLYFAVALRAEAKETINVIMKLSPFSDRQYEGSTKIQDGGRFVYWNPALSKSSYLYIDNNVNIAYGKRVDLSIGAAIYPTSLDTFKTTLYQLFTINDENENQRQYTMSTYTNSYGFGDSTTSVYVGGTNDTDCIISPGDYTYVKITMYNNAGFDWNMYGGAIEGNGVSVSSSILMKETMNIVESPSKYNFLKLSIPSEISNYITIEPSNHVEGVDPQFSDFECINAVRIRDGFEGDYYYKLTVNNGFPSQYRGRLWEINVTIIESYFDKLPSYNDPTSIHDYSLKIPPIVFGVPYPSGSKYAGKVFYTLGRASEIKVSYTYYGDFSIDDIRVIEDDNTYLLGEATASSENIQEELLKIWNKYTDSSKSYLNNKISYSIKDSKYNYKIITIDMSQLYPLLPYVVYGQPDITNFDILVKSSATQLTYGRRHIITDANVIYSDGRKTLKKGTGSPEKRYASVYGPWMTTSISEYSIIVYNDETGEYEDCVDQDIYENDEGMMKIKVAVKNTGSKDSYQTGFRFIFPQNVTTVEDALDSELSFSVSTNDDNQNILTINSDTTISQNTQNLIYIYVKFTKLENETNSTITDDGEIINDSESLRRLDSDKKNIIESLDVSLCQSSAGCEDSSLVNQLIEINFGLSYKVGSRGSVKLTVVNEGTYDSPKYSLSAEADDVDNVKSYIFYRKTSLLNDNKYVQLQKGELTNYTDSIDTKITVYKYTIGYRVETIDLNGRIIASDYFSSDLSTAEPEEENKNDGNNKNKKKSLYWIIIIVVCILIILGVLMFIFYKKKLFCFKQKDNIVHIQKPNVVVGFGEIDNIDINYKQTHDTNADKGTTRTINSDAAFTYQEGTTPKLLIKATTN